MTRSRSLERGAADAAALAAALVLGVLAFVPTLLLRRGEGWRKCREEALRIEGLRAAPGPVDPRPSLAQTLAAAIRAREVAFVPDPQRRLGPPATVEPLPAPVPPGAARVSDLDGKVAEGRLSLSWTPAPGSGATALRVEGLGGPEALEREVPAAASSLVLPVPRTSGTVVVKATPVGLPGPAVEVRVSIPFRIAVEVVRAERAPPEEGGAVLRLRRAFDGKPVEADFSVREADTVGDLASVGPEGAVVDFRTDLVLEEVRDLKAPGPFIEAPLFGADGRIQRDAEGRPLTYGRASVVDAGQEIVLRGPNDERRVVPVRWDE